MRLGVRHSSTPMKSKRNTCTPEVKGKTMLIGWPAGAQYIFAKTRARRWEEMSEKRKGTALWLVGTDPITLYQVENG